VKGRLVAGAPKTTKRFLVGCSAEARLPQAPLDGALFREFAETPQTPDGALCFANQHGWLGVAEPIVSAAFPDESHALRMRPVRGGEQIHAWMSEIAAMHRLVRVWDIVLGRRGPSHGSARFEQRIRWIQDEAILYEWVTYKERGREYIASRKCRPWLLDRLLRAKSLEPTLHWYLQIAVNEKLAQHGVRVQLLWDRKFEQLGLTMVPTNLAGFLWLQFAKAIEGETAYRQCEDCGRWFALGGRSGRADKRFCSGTCKARTHRSKKK